MTRRSMLQLAGFGVASVATVTVVPLVAATAAVRPRLARRDVEPGDAGHVDEHNDLRERLDRIEQWAAGRPVLA